MIEAFLMGLYILILSPFLYYLGIQDPYKFFILLFILSTPGLYAMLRGAPFVPTTNQKVAKMIQLAKINQNSVVYDLGSGDGRFIFAAAKAGAKKSIGYELSIPIYLLTKFRSLFNPRTQFKYRDFWFESSNLADADVVFCFLMVKTMAKFETKIWPNLKPGCLVISNVFRMPGITPIYDKDGIRVYQKTS
jgi:SAM-dependent methyltransferase